MYPYARWIFSVSLFSTVTAFTSLSAAPASERTLDRSELFFRDHPGYTKETYALGKKYYDKKEWDKAEFYFTQTLKSDPEQDDARLYLSYMYLWQGRVDEAIKGFEMILQRTPGYEDAVKGLEQARKEKSATQE